MRPSVDAPESGVYECYGCGRREADPETRMCAACGAPMRNVGRSRDL